MEKTYLQKLNESWGAMLDDDTVGPAIPKADRYRRIATAQLLENTKNEAAKSPHDFISLTEAAPTNNISGGNLATFDPILMNMVRRAAPNMISHEIMGNQTLTMPTGLIFAIKSRYVNQTGTEALFNETDTDFSGAGTHAGNNPVSGTYTTGTTMTTAVAEALGDGVGADFQEMAFSIDKVTVSVGSRALKASYSQEVAQDMKAVHNLDVDTELGNIVTLELLSAINRELIRTVYRIATPGAAYGTDVAGTFDLNTDSNGRWMEERFKGLHYFAAREANAIAKATRRGKGNYIICSSDVAEALAFAGKMTYAPEFNTSMGTVDDTGNTFLGVLNGRYKIFIDPFFGGSGSGEEFLVVGYKGSTPFDNGMFFCPYVPLMISRAIDPKTYQPSFAFKTRYGLVGNPFFGASPGALTSNTNPYYRKTKITNIS
jgi:hypothetical protein